MARKSSLDEFTSAYIEAALWSSNDESNEQGGEPLDKNYGPDDIDPATRAAMDKDCADFVDKYGSLIEDDDSAAIDKWGRWELAGHDFWLSRNGHGAGFGDGNFPKHDDELYEAAESYGTFELSSDMREYKTVSDLIADVDRRSTVRESRHHRVADFATIPDLIGHAKSVDGATHILIAGRQTKLYFPRPDGTSYEEATIWHQHGYWHAPAPADRVVVDKLPNGAEPIGSATQRAGRRAGEVRRSHAVRNYVPVDHRGRPVGAPTTDYEKAKREAKKAGGYVQFANEGVPSRAVPGSWGPGTWFPSERRRPAGARTKRRAGKPVPPMTADAVMRLAEELSSEVGGDKPTLIEKGFRWSDPNVAAQFTTYSPEYSQKVVVVLSIFADGTLAQGFFSDEGLSDRYENIVHFLYNSVDLDELAQDLKWVWETVDGYAASWQADMPEVDERRRQLRQAGTRQIKWNVYLNGKRIDSVFFVPSMDADEVRRSLVDHDGYDEGIRVQRSK